MKKLAIVIALVAILATGTAFADFGIGVHGGGGLGGGGAGLNLAFSPIYIYVDAFGLGSNSMSIFGAVDFWQFLGGNIVGDLSWYWRLGIPVGLWGFGDKLGLAVGIRAPIGLSWKPIPLIELFIHLSPQIGLQIMPEIDLWSNFFGGTGGIRFWF